MTVAELMEAVRQRGKIIGTVTTTWDAVCLAVDKRELLIYLATMDPTEEAPWNLSEAERGRRYLEIIEQ